MANFMVWSKILGMKSPEDIYPPDQVQLIRQLVDGPYYEEFISSRFPGLKKEDDILSLFQLLASKNPNNDITAKIILDGGYDPCQRYPENDIFWENIIGCDPGFISDSRKIYCYKVLETKETLTDGENYCKNDFDAELILFDTNSEVQDIIMLIKSGLLHHIRDNFYLMSSRESFGRFTFESTPINNIMFPSIQQFLPDYGDQNNFQCLRAKLNLTSSKLDLLLTNCLEQHTIICRKVQLVKPECSKTSKSSSSLTLLLDPMLKLTFKRAIAYKTAEIKDMLQRLNLRDAYTSIFNVLWHTKEMCFGLKHFLLDPDSGGSQLRYCEWKGLPITCSAIFDTFPTDQGMCCTFNMKAADKIYIETTYRNMLEKRQDMDKSLSYQNIKLSQEYVDKGEPKTIAGQNKGLILLLDTHSNQAVPGSLDGDFSGFTAVIQSSDSFPLMSQEGLHIRPGFNNIITLTSSQVVSDHSMRDLKHNDRNCLFPEETGNLKIHKQYSYLNCKFECILFYAQEQVYNKYNTLCQPWFLPTSKDSIAICDPWQSYDFFQIMSKGIPDDFCSQCLPDCNVTTYKSKVVLMPFDTCDAKNFGVSKFCNLNLKTRFPMQEKVIAQIQNEFQSNKYGYFSYVTRDKDKSGDYFWKYSSSNRTYGWNIFKKVPYSYDAFDKDIAMVHIIFKKSTLVQMGSQRTMTWIDYFSQVGGILGLLLGMGFVSFIELIWLFARMFLEVMNGRLDDDLDE